MCIRDRHTANRWDVSGYSSIIDSLLIHLFVNSGLVSFRLGTGIGVVVNIRVRKKRLVPIKEEPTTVIIYIFLFTH